MNTNIVLFNKLFVNQIRLNIKKTIYHGQVQLMPGTQGWFNNRDPINMIHWVSRSGQSKNMII